MNCIKVLLSYLNYKLNLRIKKDREVKSSKIN